jgi:hypothetical protein
MYVIRLFDGTTLPNMTWHPLERELARACDLTVHELRARIGREDGGLSAVSREAIGSDARLTPACGCESCNWTIGRLWWHVEVPRAPYLCSKRWRRHPSRLFLPWERWTAQMPDREGGDW